ncbi:MAG: DUF4113 domain-containing protein [Rhizobiales bacterium]|nr:DUF4113 domain-containing protein [Hyphomicrobiales bacterium]
MNLMDSQNTKFGAETIGLTAAGIDREWKMKQDFLSPKYTTNWNDLPKAK